MSIVYAILLARGGTMLTRGNFGYLNEHDLWRAALGAQAERYFRDDPSTAIIELRQFAELLAKLIAAHHAILGFSQQAMDFVRDLSQRVILIIGERPADLMIEHNVGVWVSRTVEFKRLDEDFFAEEE